MEEHVSVEADTAESLGHIRSSLRGRESGSFFTSLSLLNSALLLSVFATNTCTRSSSSSLRFTQHVMFINMHTSLFSVKCLVLLGPLHNSNVV